MKIFLVAGEPSGDALGARLMDALRALRGDVAFFGVGGPAMGRAGLRSLFPLEEITANGFLDVLARVRSLRARLEETAHAAIATRPDALVLIDAPDFTHRVARRVRAAAPSIPIVDYVSPTVWAWRPGRAARMRAYVDRVLALFPFEPAAHQRLGGPPCVFVGHPLVEQLDVLRPNEEERHRRAQKPFTVLAMPGSRRSEILRLAPVFGEALGAVARATPIHVIAPTPPAAESLLRAAVADWPVKPHIVTDEAEKFAAFRVARAALAASGTATLELALAQTPFVAAYRVAPIEAFIARRVIATPSIILPNLIVGQNAAPEFLQEECRAQALARALGALLLTDDARSAQTQAFAGLPQLLTPAQGAPSEAAARAICELLE
ncbi:MAG: lipid-A-disaccharide synthase [Hyphomicrobiales bacterium]|nr:lipid-A-disaccharide synthase [Hyphomicrobiales bacterium]